MPPNTVSPSKLKQPANLKEKTLTLGNMRLLDSSALNTPIYALASAPASTNKLFKQFMKAYLETQTLALVPT